MFTNLVASGGGGRRRGVMSPQTFALSIVAHGVLLAGIVYATLIAPEAEGAEEEEEVTFVEIEQQDEPPPPPPEVTPPPSNLPPAPQGFQELIPPDIILPDIPPIDLSNDVPVLSADFSGVGTRGGRADGVGDIPVAMPSVDPTVPYLPAVLEEQPRLINTEEASRLLERFFPRFLLDQRVNGRVTVQFVITADGRVNPSTVRIINTTHQAFGDATLQAIEGFRFSPGRYGGQAVQVLIEMPIDWTAR